MSKTSSNDFIFPQEKDNPTAMNGSILGPGQVRGGLTKREYYAAMAMQGFLARENTTKFGAASWVEAADALIEILDKKESVTK